MHFFLLSQLNRRGGKGKGHDSCSAPQCAANNVDMSHYETKHRTPSCRCNFAEIHKPPLIEIIKSGGISFVSVQLDLIIRLRSASKKQILLPDTLLFLMYGQTD